MESKNGDHHEREAEQLLASGDFFSAAVQAPADLTFTGRDQFAFTSVLRTFWPNNNTVHGQFFRAGKHWRERPAVILLHGWNSELSYARQFPLLAWRLNRLGLNAAMFQLPFHGRRRPSGPGVINNFISHDLLAMVEATQQALFDARSLSLWLIEQGCPNVGLWGISLGAWLSGLLVCNDSHFSFGVLMTPVPNVELAVRELDFCAPIRQALQSLSVDFSKLNLATMKPRIPKENVLLIEATHDVFAPAEVIEDLWNCWEHPEIWRVRHGHISVLLSLPLMERTVRWLSRTAKNCAPHRLVTLRTGPLPLA